MVRICAWCERYLGVKDSAAVSVTHGICPPCSSRQELKEAPTLILSRDRETLVSLFRNLLRGAPEIQIIVDRRLSERRREQRREPPPGGKPRGQDRRRGLTAAVV